MKLGIKLLLVALTRAQTNLVFKDGENIFVANGRFSGFYDDAERVLNGHSNIEYEVLSYGADDITRMAELHTGARVLNSPQNVIPESVPQTPGPIR